MNERLPAILGGPPAFDTPLNIVAPILPSLDAIAPRVEEILRTGQLTNDGRNVREFEGALASRFGVPVVTTSNGTWSLVLALKELDATGEVIVPSYTYCASAHAIRWAGAQPVFVDILADTFTVDPAAVRAAITPRTSAILAVHIYGHPCEINELTSLAREKGLKLVFDAAHAFGAWYRGAQVGTFGDAESFSFHATKTLPVGEGGCVTTASQALADRLRLARKFGDPGDEDTLFAGTNAKMQEFNAILGLEGLRTVDACIARRREYATYLRTRLAAVPGLSFQQERAYAKTSAQNFAVLVDEREYGLGRDLLHQALLAENIRCRKYFYPPLHHHKSYRASANVHLPVTEAVSDRVLCLPFYSNMSFEQLDRMADAFDALHKASSRIRRECPQPA